MRDLRGRVSRVESTIGLPPDPNVCQCPVTVHYRDYEHMLSAIPTPIQICKLCGLPFPVQIALVQDWRAEKPAGDAWDLRGRAR
jgi:hypothetical protein